ncbi:YcxB family protein [Inquilinus limosus]|uniref:YcxB-like C-terminal domain-containing protein n=1 Tax=Inquilinus limosus TaxID=171674 RepID=A0A211ZNP1_9PROT|nr:YcxB family protein [Inquilinus limosus]OWJ66881.1 hypothetical protein BWR60_12365 [Inquilinus limosus]
MAVDPTIREKTLARYRQRKQSARRGSPLCAIGTSWRAAPQLCRRHFTSYAWHKFLGWPILSTPLSSVEQKRIEFSYSLDRSDYVEFSVSRANRPELRARNRKRFAVEFPVWVLIGLALLALMRGGLDKYITRSTVLFFCLGLMLVGLACIVFRQQILRRSIRRTIGSNPGATFEGRVDLTLDEQGVDCRSDGTRSRMEWRAFHGVEESPTHIYLMLSEIQGLIIPKRDLSPALTSEIVRFSKECLALNRI